MSGDNSANVTGAPSLLTPTTTWPLTNDGVFQMGSELVAICGLTGPRPVTKAVTVSPRRAGVERHANGGARRRAGLEGPAKVPSGRSITARTTPSDWAV